MTVGTRVRFVQLLATDRWMREHFLPLLGAEGTVVGLSETQASMPYLVDIAGAPRPIYVKPDEIEVIA